ncbi:MAG: flagellar export chaperone FlgN [Pseudomonadota bacterium]
MEKFTENIETLLNKKLSLYQQMNDLLKQEREFIVNIDVGSLWKSSDQKRQIAEQIQAVKTQILAVLKSRFSIDDLDVKSFSISYLIRTIPVASELKKRFRQIKVAIDAQKDELKQVAINNKKYVQEYLMVIDDIMSVIVDNSKQAQYGHTGKMPTTKTSNCLFHAEV